MADTSFWNGRTFDDFLFRPQKGVVGSRREVELTSRLTPGLKLELPIVSANMNSVTGARMAKAMALEGGLGVVHRGSSIERQQARVASVKRTRSAVIQEPLRLPIGTTIREAKRFAARHNITGILIEAAPDSRVLAGLLSQRDMPWTDEHEDRFVEEFMTPFDRLVVERPGITPQEAGEVLFEQRIERLPLVDEKRRIHGLITRKDLLFLRERPYASRDEEGRLLVGAAIGARGDYLERAAALLEAGADCLFMDIAHGHSVVIERAIAGVRKHFGSVPLVCGNVATGEGARFLADCSADGIKVGVGPGRGCRTRMETAAGVPQLQAIREAWLAVKESIPIMADGGVRHDKDIFLALVCGASTVMLGSVLSGTDEAPGRVIEDPATHEKRKIYRGMTSPGAVFEALYDSDTESGETDPELEEALATAAEGQEMQVPYKGSVTDVLERVRDHVRSAVSYAGKRTLAAARQDILPEPSRFLVALSEASRRESYER